MLVICYTGIRVNSIPTCCCPIRKIAPSDSSLIHSVGLATAMEPLEQTLLVSITKLTAKLSSMENKLDKFAGDLRAMRTKAPSRRRQEERRSVLHE
jgi:hypothetical protein